MSLVIYKALKNDNINAEREKLEKQHQWDVEADDITNIKISCWN